MPSAIAWLLAVVILLAPPASVVGLVVWARRLRKRGAPRFAIVVAYVLAALVALVIVAGYVGSLIVATHDTGSEGVEPSQKARALAEAMNSGAFALLVAVVGPRGSRSGGGELGVKSASSVRCAEGMEPEGGGRLDSHLPDR